MNLGLNVNAKSVKNQYWEEYPNEKWKRETEKETEKG